MQFYCPSHIYAEIYSPFYTFFAFLVHCENTSQNLNMLPTRPQIRGPRKTKTDLEIFENVFFVVVGVCYDHSIFGSTATSP